MARMLDIGPVAWQGLVVDFECVVDRMVPVAVAVGGGHRESTRFPWQVALMDALPVMAGCVLAGAVVVGRTANSRIPRLVVVTWEMAVGHRRRHRHLWGN